ncbi:hypothetical protein CO662_31315 [Rhizobium anhuiense]|uniref:Uncharacterized protein n=1 Tax=Rhizobium anhuiense TaxID=1184720 RepID=A0ABX4IYX2_9HYPH|nr:hypothetical protein [Rhizobium anhuiense]PDS40961.1 hypothetical protein CO668_31510 [Rhizobium anhuiense]PDS48115.1 hypothetical protein CO662_31315 [Rhizobium anhuiense]
MFLRHDPSSLCNTTGALFVAATSPVLCEMLFGRQAIMDITIAEAPNLDGCLKVDLSSNFALLYGGASPQPV